MVAVAGNCELVFGCVCENRAGEDCASVRVDDINLVGVGDAEDTLIGVLGF